MKNSPPRRDSSLCSNYGSESEPQRCLYTRYRILISAFFFRSLNALQTD